MRSQDFCLGEGVKLQLACDDAIRIFEKKDFLWNKISEDQKPVSGLERNQDFAKTRGLGPKVEKFSKNV